MHVSTNNGNKVPYARMASQCIFYSTFLPTDVFSWIHHKEAGNLLASRQPVRDIIYTHFNHKDEDDVSRSFVSVGSKQFYHSL